MKDTFDYTKDQQLMNLLSSLSLKVEGWNYMINSGGYSNELVGKRHEELNKSIEELKNYLTGEHPCHRI